MMHEFKKRRQRLASLMQPNSAAIISGAEEQLRNGDAHYRFRQSSDFYYLTGFNEPDALLVITSGRQPRSYLFNRPRNPAEEQWTGTRLGQEKAVEILAVDEAFPAEKFKEQLAEILAGKEAVYYDLEAKPSLNTTILNTVKSLKKQIRRGIKSPAALLDIEPLISEMRLFKSAAEISLMRKAAEISVAAHLRAMQTCKKLENEGQLEAELIYEFTRQGCRSMAYDPIVGSGANACILHYTQNNRPLEPGSLVLIDAGGEFENYAADITRTFPVSGRFSEAQKQIYNLVLKAQKAGIACVRPGMAWNVIQETIVRILTEGLRELGILQGNVEDLIHQGAYKPYYMHNSGHWLGLDVHDAGSYRKNEEWRPLEPGMVLTVEPGLYLSPNPDLDRRWHNIGIRIEDDILVTESGFENLSGALPVEVGDLEACVGG